MDWLEKVRNCNRQTQLQRLAAIRSFVRYGGIIDLRVISIQADVEKIRYRKPAPALVGYLTKEGLSAFLSQPNCQKRTGFRNMVFLVLMYDTAARCQEMLDLRIQDLVLHRTSPCVYLTGKGKLQEVVRALRRAGGIVNDSCGMHVHVDASKHTPQSLKNVLSIMYSKEDILFAALKVNPARIDSYCQAVDEPILEEIRKLPSGASMDQLKDRWYQGRDGSDYHYHSSRYRACNMHSVFYHGTIEWRLFNSTLHAGEAKANIILAMAISAQGINQKYTQFRKTPIGDNPAFTFRTFLLRLGLIGPEYKNVRMHLLKNLPGDKAWRHDKSLYPSNQPRPRTDEAR